MATSGVVQVIGGAAPAQEFTFYYKTGAVTFVDVSGSRSPASGADQRRIGDVFESIEIVTEVTAPDLVRTGLLSGVGAFMLGPVGLLAGAIALTNGKSKKVTFRAKLRCDGEIVAQTDGETFSQMLAQHCTQKSTPHSYVAPQTACTMAAPGKTFAKPAGSIRAMMCSTHKTITK
jgi:hypothetical protein